MTTRSSAKTQGQAMVEAAIVLPLFIFTILGLIQMTQVYQANAMLKYAAYRAARTGALNSLDKDKMLRSALITMAAVNTISGAVKGEVSTAHLASLATPAVTGVPQGIPVTLDDLDSVKLTDSSNLTNNSTTTRNAASAAAAAAFKIAGLDDMEVRICGPLSNWFNEGQKVYSHNREEFGPGKRAENEVDFDDPKNTYSRFKLKEDSTFDGNLLGFTCKDESEDNWAKIQNFERTKLKIQLIYYHRLVVPFANWIIYEISQQRNVARVIRLNRRERGVLDQLGSVSLSGTDALAMAGIYVLKMYAGYSFRMQSNFKIDNLPSSPSGCIAPENKKAEGNGDEDAEQEA